MWLLLVLYAAAIAIGLLLYLLMVAHAQDRGDEPEGDSWAPC
jgi:hypothetical protein